MNTSPRSGPASAETDHSPESQTKPGVRVAYAGLLRIVEGSGHYAVGLSHTELLRAHPASAAAQNMSSAERSSLGRRQTEHVLGTSIAVCGASGSVRTAELDRIDKTLDSFVGEMFSSSICKDRVWRRRMYLRD